MPTKVKRYMVPIPPGKEALIKKLAQRENRTVSNYVQNILIRTLEEAEQAPYGAIKQIPSAPNKGQRASGAGPDAAISA